MNPESWRAAGVVLRVDMAVLGVAAEPLPAAWQALGGRALCAEILIAEVPPTCDPLGADNRLVVAPGLLAGTAACTSGRVSFAAKSPLTGGIKEANSGGEAGQQLARMGVRAIVFAGRPAEPAARYGLIIDAASARLVDAAEFAGQGNYAVCAALTARHGARAAFIVCGPAGERQLAAASIACSDRAEKLPTRHAARGGLGAVMGSKGLKYIVIEPGEAQAPPRAAADDEAFAAAAASQAARYLGGPRRMAKGTARAVAKAAGLLTLPYRNRRAGTPPAADVAGLDGAAILASFPLRGGKMHHCMTGCIVKCSNRVHRVDGSHLTSALELETLGLLGSNCGLGQWDEVGELDRLCDDVGVDTMETGVALGVLMDAGRMAWGDLAAMREAIAGIAEGSALGLLVGGGACHVGRCFDHVRVPAVKGQGMPVWDPRVMKATGVTYATSAMGADHTAGIVTLVGLPDTELAALSQEAQLLNAIGDAAGFCQFMQATVTELAELASALLGVPISGADLAAQGWHCLQLEWEFNRRAGFTEADDLLPAFFGEEPIGEWDYRYTVGADVLRRVKQERLPLAEDFFSKPIF